MSELAYKFTRPGPRSPFTGFVWRPGEWVEAEGDVELCANGIHACRLEALPRWIDEELWRFEIEGPSDEFEGVVVARRARPVERIEGWNTEASRELARSCAGQARRLADESADPLVGKMVRDIGRMVDGPDTASTALVMYCTARVFEVAVHGGYTVERNRQAEWLRDRLRLEPA